MAPSTAPLLCKLPAEIRNEIYRLVLKSTGPIKMKLDRVSHTYMTILQDKVYYSAPPNSMALLHTCKQIREEAIGIFFGENVFLTDLEIGGCASPVLPAWLQAIGPSSTKLLTCVEARVLWSANWFNELASATYRSSRPLEEAIDEWTEKALLGFIPKVKELKATMVEPTVLKAMNDLPARHSVAGPVELRLRAALPVLMRCDGLTEPAVVMEKMRWRI